MTPWDGKQVQVVDDDVALYNLNGKFYALHRFCGMCGHEEFLTRFSWVGDRVIFGSDADHCTSCGEMQWWV